MKKEARSKNDCSWRRPAFWVKYDTDGAPGISHNDALLRFDELKMKQVLPLFGSLPSCRTQ